MAKTTKNPDAQVASALPEEEEKTLSEMVTDTPEDADDTADQDSSDEFAEDCDAEDTEDDNCFLVVVCKGHTLYHDGNKYPATHRLRMDAEDASRLLKRGVVVKYDDLLKKVSADAG